MKLNFNPDGFTVPVDPNLIKQLELLTDKENLEANVTELVFNFRDKSYSANLGGYHPVEISIYLENAMWNFEYITDFSYLGSVFPELIAEVDFDFRNNILNVSYASKTFISAEIDFFNLWQSNFLSYLLTGAFDEIEVS
ncbi:DUF2787 family protein [uncultured Psychromonas sp.]|uniref:DUF2787 family protein n=1 Tax=uncultured Psychromonas sp. TaxID=173974 RepID=UPI0026259254|nr:DUF2787 family protein [uncultured Psychromonas sp.]